MAQPVFVLGRRRSGTKWLSNILAGHPDVACVQGRRSGILETCMFDRFPDLFGDLNIDCNFGAFLACYSKSDFFRITGVAESDLYRFGIRNYFALFRALMDRYAQEQGRSIWLQKSKSYLLPKFFEAYPDAKYVLIRRDIQDNLKSSIALSMQSKRAGGASPAGIVRAVASYYFHQKSEEAYAGRDNVMTVRFEDLKSGTESTVREICRFLEIDFHSRMLAPGFEQNTSFTGSVRKEHALRGSDRALFSLVDAAIRHLPLPVLEHAFRLRRRFSPIAFSEPRFQESYFNQLNKEHGLLRHSAPRTSPPNGAVPSGRALASNR